MTEEAMSIMSNERLVQELILAAYDTGFYSGKGEDGKPHHTQAIAQREFLRKAVLLRLQGTCGLACHTDKAI